MVLVITRLRLRGLRNFLVELCPLHGTSFSLTEIDDHTAELVCQYEGYAMIVKGLLRKYKNVAKFRELGYNKIVIRLGQRDKPIAIAKVFDCFL